MLEWNRYMTYLMKFMIFFSKQVFRSFWIFDFSWFDRLKWEENQIFLNQYHKTLILMWTPNKSYLSHLSVLDQWPKFIIENEVGTGIICSWGAFIRNQNQCLFFLFALAAIICSFVRMAPRHAMRKPTIAHFSYVWHSPFRMNELFFLIVTLIRILLAQLRRSMKPFISESG